MCFRIPSGEPEPFLEIGTWLAESGLPMLLFTAAAAVSARAPGRCRVVVVHLIALAIQLALLRVRNLCEWGVGPIVVILLMGGLWRAIWPPPGPPEAGATGLSRA